MAVERQVFQNADLRLLPNPHIPASTDRILTEAELAVGEKTPSKVGKIRWEDLSQLAILQPGEAYCAYCGKMFQKTRANHIYCNSIHEREKQIIRKENLIIALACHLDAWGWKARDMLLLARQMVNDAYKMVMRMMEGLGYRWVESKKLWVFKPKTKVNG